MKKRRNMTLDIESYGKIHWDPSMGTATIPMMWYKKTAARHLLTLLLSSTAAVSHQAHFHCQMILLLQSLSTIILFSIIWLLKMNAIMTWRKLHSIERHTSTLLHSMDIWWWSTFHLTIILLFIYYFVSSSIFHFPSDSFTCSNCRGDMNLNKCEWCSDRRASKGCY
jgi:hypothetical protein